MRALARACGQPEPTEFDDDVGAAWVGDHGFHYTEDDPRVVGRALRWAQARGLTRIELFTPSGASELARRAALVDGRHLEPAPTPTVGVWAVDGAEVTPAQPGPAIPPPPVPDEHWSLAALMTEAGARPIDDHGVLVAEVAGLEVARVVEGGEGPVIDVGVGQADRELNQVVHTASDPVTDMRRVIASVNEYRLRNDHHPLQRLARERWLRSVLLDDPARIEAGGLAPLVPRRGRRG
ncbi:MAG: hypothetical protein AAFN30_19245, partial [Actinomycetota bacterium]